MPSTLNRPNGSPTTNCRDTAELILDTFAPADPDGEYPEIQGPIQHMNELDPQVVKSAIWRIRTTSAPGTDGVTPGILRKAWPALRDNIMSLFDRCLQDGRFPECWKTARLVIIPKPGKDDYGEVKSYRPISLLPVLGKALESVIITELTR